MKLRLERRVGLLVTGEVEGHDQDQQVGYMYGINKDCPHGSGFHQSLLRASLVFGLAFKTLHNRCN